MEGSVKQYMNVHCCEIFRYDVLGISTHYTDKVWVDDKESLEGGYYRSIEKRRDRPKIIIDFYSDVNVELIVNSVYSDGDNLFRAVGAKTIRNEDHTVHKFSIPSKLLLITSN